jgi:Dyp-type peroxidase family
MINQFDIKNRELLSGIQGNILKGHGREHTANLFISGKPHRKEQVKKWLNELVDPMNGIIKSGYSQLYDIQLWKTQKIDGGMFACIHIAAEGYKYLFVDKKVEDNFGVKTSFYKGMKNANLKDPSSNKWDATFQTEIHFHLLIADNKKQLVKEQFENIKESIKEFAEVVGVEFGDAIKNQEGAGIEHFGYVDGISQPLFFEDEMEKFLKENHVSKGVNPEYNPSDKNSIVLVEDPFEPKAKGSYFVFRKLEQNVRGFKEAELQLADNLSLKGEDKERAGAMIVGRFEDGTPVEVSDEPGIIGNRSFNNFKFINDDMSRCPYHAHIRKTNPRNDIDDAKKAVMARRGIPYGTRNDDPFDGRIDTKPTRGVGLLFQSYQASIENQFERIQISWANDENFLKNKTGLDLIIGQGNYPSESEYQTEWNSKDLNKIKKASFKQFVAMKGGEYFFAPSILFLENVK